MKNFFEKVLSVYDREIGKFLWVCAIFCGTFFIMAFFRSYVDTVFLKRYGADSIPVMLLINGVVTVAVFWLTKRFSIRFSDYKLLSGFLLLCAAMITILFFMVRSGSAIAYPILFQILNLQDSFFLVYLWNLACDMFDARQGKRIFPLIMAGQVLGTALGSFMTSPVASYAGYESLLILSSTGYFVVALALALSAGRMIDSAVLRKPETMDVRKKPSEIVSMVKQYPILRFLVVSGFIPNILLPIFTYQFSVIAQHSFATEQALLTFLSVFRGSITLLSFLILVIVGRAYAKMGLPNASLIQPINFACVFSTLIPFFNIFIAAYGQFSTTLIQRAIAGPANKIFFNVVPTNVASWARIFIRGTAVKAGVITGALIMVAIKSAVSPRGMAILAFLISVYWIVEAVLFKKRYNDILKQVLTDGGVDFDMIRSEMAIGQDTTSMVFHAGVIGSPKYEALHSTAEKVINMPEEALEMLKSNDETVRAQAASFFADNCDIRALNPLIKCLNEKGIVREKAIESIAAYGEEVVPFLESALLDYPQRIQLGILEAARYSGLKMFNVSPFVFRTMTIAYNNMIAIETLLCTEGSGGYEILKTHLSETNRELLNMVFLALWIRYKDMKLVYESLHTGRASAAIEMVETNLDVDIARYLIPFIDDRPYEEKIAAVRKMLPVLMSDDLAGIYSELARSRDPVTRMLVAYAIGEYEPQMIFYPVAEKLLDDGDEGVRQAAAYAVKRCLKGEAKMPEIIYDMNILRRETLFDGVTIKGYNAIASIATQKFFKKGDIIIREGKEVLSFYIVTDGQVIAYERYGTESQRRIYGVAEGDAIGEVALFSHIPSALTYVVDSDFLETLAFNRHAFYEIMNLHPQIAINLCRQFALRLSEKKPDLNEQ